MATPDKSVESASESLFGDERLRSNLTDDEANLVRQRLDLFDQLIADIIPFYKKTNRLIEIDGNRSIEEVSQECLSELKFNCNRFFGS